MTKEFPLRQLMPEEYAKVMYPFLERSLEDEWKLIKQKKSTLSRMKRDIINNVCETLTKEQKTSNDNVDNDYKRSAC